MGVGRTVSEVDEEPIRENERNVNDLFIEYYLPPAARFLPIAAFFIGNVPPAAHFSQQLEKWAKEPPETNGLWTPFTLKSFVCYGP